MQESHSHAASASGLGQELYSTPLEKQQVTLGHRLKRGQQESGRRKRQWGRDGCCHNGAGNEHRRETGGREAGCTRRRGEGVRPGSRPRVTRRLVQTPRSGLTGGENARARRDGDSARSIRNPLTEWETDAEVVSTDGSSTTNNKPGGTRCEPEGSEPKAGSEGQKGERETPGGEETSAHTDTPMRPRSRGF